SSRLSPFFSSRSAAPRDLPSFPTRRSSDLDDDEIGDLHGALAGSATPRARSSARRGNARSRKASRSSRAAIRASRSWRRAARSRSEEHTSELQSRSDLVCRLLLEKKKKKTN